MMPRLAALPMYDFAPLRPAHEVLWSALAWRLRDRGVQDVPASLSWHLGYRETWVHPGLLLGQACEYPLSKRYQRCLQVVATPSYGAPGCGPGTYRSAVVVRKADPAQSLRDLRQRVCVINETDSNSGMNLLRAALAPAAGPGRFFRETRVSHAHRLSLMQVAAGEADVAAVDCVTLAHLALLQPDLVHRLRVLEWTPESPCLPYVTSQRTDPVTLQTLQAVLVEVLEDESLKAARETLLLTGVTLETDQRFSRIRYLERQAQRHQYPVLA